jgi:hypothetical protein
MSILFIVCIRNSEMEEEGGSNKQKQKDDTLNKEFGVSGIPSQKQVTSANLNRF